MTEELTEQDIGGILVDASEAAAVAMEARAKLMGSGDLATQWLKGLTSGYWHQLGYDANMWLQSPEASQVIHTELAAVPAGKTLLGLLIRRFVERTLNRDFDTYVRETVC